MSAIRLLGYHRFPVPSDSGRPIVLPTPLMFDSLSNDKQKMTSRLTVHFLAGDSAGG